MVLPEVRPTCGHGAQAGSLQFLSEQGFDFNRWIRDGVSYLPAGDCDMLRHRLTSAANRKDDRPTITVQKEEDVQFVNELVAQVSAWSEVRSVIPREAVAGALI